MQRASKQQTTLQLQASENLPVTELVCTVRGKRVRVKIDTADLPKVLSVSSKWLIANFYPRGWRMYAYIRQRDPQRGQSRTIYLHRVITDAPAGMEVDHINHDSLDNRRCNLRVVTHKQNLNNRIDQKRSAEMFGGKQ